VNRGGTPCGGGHPRGEVLDFARFVRERAERAAREQAELLAAAESAWGPDWSNADEDDAWATL
jgi:hypothetical protein